MVSVRFEVDADVYLKLLKLKGDKSWRDFLLGGIGLQAGHDYRTRKKMGRITSFDDLYGEGWMNSKEKTAYLDALKRERDFQFRDRSKDTPARSPGPRRYSSDGKASDALDTLFEFGAENKDKLMGKTKTKDKKKGEKK